MQYDRTLIEQKKANEALTNPVFYSSSLYSLVLSLSVLYSHLWRSTLLEVALSYWGQRDTAVLHGSLPPVPYFSSYHREHSSSWDDRWRYWCLRWWYRPWTLSQIQTKDRVVLLLFIFHCCTLPSIVLFLFFPKQLLDWMTFFEIITDLLLSKQIPQNKR